MFIDISRLSEDELNDLYNEMTPAEQRAFCVEMEAQADEEYKNRMSNNWREWKGNA